MVTFTKKGSLVFNGRDLSNNAVSVANSEASVWATEIESAVDLATFISAGASTGAIVKDSLSGLNSDLAHDASSMAWVVGDSTLGNDGIYQKQGASGSGSWTRIADLPYSIIQLYNADAGTANAIQATSSLNIPSSAYGALLVLNITASNTGAVTLSVNGETAKPIVTNTNQAITSGYLVAGMAAICVDDGASFRLFSYGDATAVQAAAEAAQTAAENARDDAIDARNDAIIAHPLSPFASLADMLSDTDMGYGQSDVRTVIEGQPINANGFMYVVAASTATDQDFTTAGGAKLYVPKYGETASGKAFGLTGSGDETATIDLIEAATGFTQVDLGGLDVTTTREQTSGELTKSYFNGNLVIEYNNGTFDAKPNRSVSQNEITPTIRVCNIAEWANRTVLWLGTSIPHESNADNSDYPNLVAKANGFNVINNAWAGSHATFDPDADETVLNNVKALSMTEADRRAERAVHGASSIYDDSFDLVTLGSQMTVDYRVVQTIQENPEITLIVLDHNHNDRFNDIGTLTPPSSAISSWSTSTETIDGQVFQTVVFSVGDGSLWSVGDGAAAVVVGVSGLSNCYGRVTSVSGNDVEIAYDATGLSGSLTSGTLYNLDRNTIAGAWEFLFYAIKNAAERYSTAGSIIVVTANSYLHYTANADFESGVASVGRRIEQVSDKWLVSYYDAATDMAISSKDRLIMAGDGTHPTTLLSRQVISAHWSNWMAGGKISPINENDFLPSSGSTLTENRSAALSPFTQAFETPEYTFGEFSNGIPSEFFTGTLSSWTIAGTGAAPVIETAPWDAAQYALKANANAANQNSYIYQTFTGKDGFDLEFDLYAPVVENPSISGVRTVICTNLNVSVNGGNQSYFRVSMVVTATSSRLRFTYSKVPNGSGDDLVNLSPDYTLEAGKRHNIRVVSQKAQSASEAGRISVYVDEALHIKDIEMDNFGNDVISRIEIGTIFQNLGVSTDYYFGNIRLQIADVEDISSPFTGSYDPDTDGPLRFVNGIAYN